MGFNPKTRYVSLKFGSRSSFSRGSLGQMSLKPSNASLELEHNNDLKSVGTYVVIFSSNFTLNSGSL
jgi:hypothetical protein